jgi:hypothetical protein
MQREETIAAIRGLVSELDDVLAGISRDEPRIRPSPDEWSILEVCCHLRDAAEIDHERIVRMASEHEPVIRAYDNEALARERRYNDEHLAAVRVALAGWWARLADTLDALPPDAWERIGLHEERGPITLGWRAQRQAEHPREHFEQMRSVRERLAATPP